MVSQVDSHTHRRVDLLHAGRTTITDIVCNCPRSACGPPRHSDAYQLVFVRAGVFVKHNVATGQRGIAAQPAHVIFLDRGEHYCISHPSSRGDACTVLAFSTDSVRDAVAECAPHGRTVSEPPFPGSHAVLSPDVALRLQRLRLSLRAAAVAPVDADAEAIALLRCVLAAAWKQREGQVTPKQRLSRRQQELTETVKELLARHPAAATSLDDLAVYLGVSPFYLARTFRRQAGISIHQYLLRLRLGLALDKMSDSSLRLSAIALDVGFSSPSHFTSAFRKTFGIPPAEWRMSTARRAVLGTQGESGGLSAPSAERCPQRCA